MDAKRAAAVEREFLQRVREVYRETVHFARTHDEHIQAVRSAIWENPKYTAAPGWVKSAIQGAHQTLFDLLFTVQLSGKNNSPLVAISIGPDGRQFGPGDERWLQESSEYKTAMKIEHVWRERWDRGEYKPF